jgi:hypothetical protein
LKGSVPQISQQAIEELSASFLKTWELGTVGQEDVCSAVTVEVQYRNATTHLRYEVLPSIESVVCDVGEIGSGGGVRERNARWRRHNILRDSTSGGES